MPRDYETPEYLRRLPPAEHAAIEVELLMSEPEVAREVLRQLDLALRPWGAPGDVPEEPGEYWMALHGKLWPVSLGEDLSLWVPDWGPGPHEMPEGPQFRKRWTPEAP